MSPDSTGVLLLYSILPTLIACTLNAGEAAIVYVDDNALRHQIATGDKKAARLHRFAENHKSLEIAMFVFSLMTFVLSGHHIQKLVQSLSTTVFQGGWMVFWILLYGILFTAIGIITPKRIAAYYPEGIAFATLPLLVLVNGLFKPIVWIIMGIGSIVVRLTGNDPKNIPSNVTEEEIRMLVDEGEEYGVIEEQEKDMINNIFEFDQRTVDEVMTHRTQVCAADVLSDLNRLVQLAMETGYSRLPIYEEDVDSVIGIIYVKDLLPFFGDRENFSARDAMRPALFVPETTTCAQMLTLFKTRKTQIAVVIDEYGGTYGIVTMEDLLEAIVGNIQDEYDNEAELFTQLEEGVYLIGGAMPINDLERLLDIQIPEDIDCDTVGGFVTELLGGVPRNGEEIIPVRFGGVVFTVTETNEKRIVKLTAHTHSPNLQ